MSQLSLIITSLKNLTHLDISRTNLAVVNPKTNEIEALKSLSKPLEFLGIYQTNISENVKNIPAKRVSRSLINITFFMMLYSRNRSLEVQMRVKY